MKIAKSPRQGTVRHVTKIPTGNNFQNCHERDQTWRMLFDQHYFQNRNL